MKWAAVDVETTGLVPGVHQIWEVAVVQQDGSTVLPHPWSGRFPDGRGCFPVA